MARFRATVALRWRGPGWFPGLGFTRPTGSGFGDGGSCVGRILGGRNGQSCCCRSNSASSSRTRASAAMRASCSMLARASAATRASRSLSARSRSCSKVAMCCRVSGSCQTSSPWPHWMVSGSFCSWLTLCPPQSAHGDSSCSPVGLCFLWAPVRWHLQWLCPHLLARLFRSVP